MFRCTPIPRTARLAISLPIFFRHMLYGDQSSMIASSSRVLPFGTLRCSSRTMLRTFGMCLARLIRISRRVILRGQNCYHLYCFLNRLRYSKNPQANNFAPRRNSECQTLLQFQNHAISMFPNKIAALTHKRLIKRTARFMLSILIWMRMDLFIFREDSIELEAMRNPIILLAHPLLVLIIQYHHLRTLHTGPQLMPASLRHEFWILLAHATVQSVLYKCISTRWRAHRTHGDLLAARVNRTVCTFVHTGVNYAGPIIVRTPVEDINLKKPISRYSCLTAKVHLELFSDYTSLTFSKRGIIAAYQRFVSRWGLSTSIPITEPHFMVPNCLLHMQK